MLSMFSNISRPELSEIRNLKSEIYWQLTTDYWQLKKDYKKIKKVITILITDFTLIRNSPLYHNRFKLRNVEGTAEFGDIIEINTLELPKLPENESWDDLLIWLEFFRAKTEDDFMKLINEGLTAEQIRERLSGFAE